MTEAFPESISSKDAMLHCSVCRLSSSSVDDSSLSWTMSTSSSVIDLITKLPSKKP
jgi:hypothetical protein